MNMNIHIYLCGMYVGIEREVPPGVQWDETEVACVVMTAFGTCDLITDTTSPRELPAPVSLLS